MDIDELETLALRGDKEAIRKLAELARLAERHPVTGLYSKHKFNSENDLEEKRLQRDKTRGGVIMKIDLAGFKRINDTYGYEEGGNHALKEFAKHLKEFPFRDTDMFFHTGGDEFYVILPDATLKAEDAGMKDAFGNASDPKGAWKRVEDFIRSSRAILIEGVDMHGKSYSDHIHARIAVSDYGISSPKGRSLDKALNHIARQESALQQLTNLYVPSGRQSFTA